jgi:hypothetical protein
MQLIELLLAITLLATIALTGNILLTGSANRSLTIKAKAEMGEQMNYLFKRMESFMQDIQPEVMDSSSPATVTLFGKGVSTPYVSSQPGLATTTRWPAADTMSGIPSIPSGGLVAGGLYLAFFNNASPNPAGFGIFFTPLSTGQIAPHEGKLEFYSRDPAAPANATREVIIPNGLFPYAAVEDYVVDNTIDSFDLTALQACISNFNDRTKCVDRPAKSIWPVFEISTDRKSISVSFQMGRKVGGNVVYSRPVTKVFLIRGEKVGS